MTIKQKFFLLILISFLTLFSCSHKQSVSELMDLYATDGCDEGIGSPFNGVILVAKNDQLLLKKAYGFYDYQTKRELKIDSPFLIGSVTKQFTAMLVLIEVENGKIGLENPISEYLPDFPKDIANRITIHHLLSHSSGLPHYNGFRNLGINRNEFFKSKYSPDDLAKLIAKVKLIYKPGEHFYYSSLGYFLLGVILEKATGKPYSILLEENIVNPLGLKNTGYADNQFTDKNVVKGYKLKELYGLEWLISSDGREYVNDDFRDQSTTYSTGGMHSTLDDLWKWTKAVKQSKLISPELTQKMLSPNKVGYCYGWFRNHETVIRRNPSVKVHAHGGALPGFRSRIALYDDGTTIIFMSNLTPVNDIRLSQNLHLAANDVNVDNFKRDLVRPEIEEDLDTFLEDGGINAFRDYYAEISKRAEYKVIPAQLAYLELISLYINANERIEAEKFAHELLGNYPLPDQNIINQLGYLFLRTGSTGKAIKYFQINVKNYSYSANVYDSMGEAYEAANQYRLAEENYRKAIEIAESNASSNLQDYKEHLKNVFGKINAD